MPTVYRKNKVAIDKCNDYDINEIRSILTRQLTSLGLDFKTLENKKVVIKPNLIAPDSGTKAITTNPSMLEALILILNEYGADVTIAESPGGPYTEIALKAIYSTCKISDVAARTGAKLNFDTSYQNFPAPDGKISKNFNIITPICEADIIFNLCKLKTHSLATMTCAAKNLFGTIPGLQKFETHARFNTPKTFFDVLCDLADTLCTHKKIYHIADAVIGMEGNGPSAGTPRKIGCIVSGENPFEVDLLCSEIIGLDGCVGMVNEAVKRGYCPSNSSELEIDGSNPKDFYISDFKKPEASGLKFLSHIPRSLQPHPEINLPICIGCGLCQRSCPVKAISISEQRSKSITPEKKAPLKASINHSVCIRCYCCQELCPHKAVYIKKNFVYKIIYAINGKKV